MQAVMRMPFVAKCKVWARVALAGLMGALVPMLVLMPVAGCSQATTTQIVQKVQQWAPSIDAGVDTVAATIEMLAPADAIILQVATTGIDALAVQVEALCKAYLANPTAGVLAQIQTAVNTLEQTVNNATLQAAGIKDAESQRLAVAALKGLATVTSVVFGLIQTTETHAQLRAFAEQDTIKLASVRPYMDAGLLQTAALDNGVTVDQFFAFETAHGF